METGSVRLEDEIVRLQFGPEAVACVRAVRNGGGGTAVDAETAVVSRQSVVANGGLEPFYTTLQRYPKNAAIVEVVLRALRCLADGSSDVNRIASAAYLRTLMLVYSNFGTDAKLTTLFVQLICSLSAIESCQAAIIQSGIREIIYFSDKYAETANIRASKRMLDAAGVHYHPLQTELASITLDFRAPESAGIPQKSDADEK